ANHISKFRGSRGNRGSWIRGCHGLSAHHTMPHAGFRLAKPIRNPGEKRNIDRGFVVLNHISSKIHSVHGRPHSTDRITERHVPCLHVLRITCHILVSVHAAISTSKLPSLPGQELGSI